MNWNKILNWKLLSGSHKFPGPDGGTCINEAAIVAAGFDYCSVSSADDCPPCFSRVLSTHAIILNDSLPDDIRQELLLPFITRLAGTADTPKIERLRFNHIILGAIREVLPITLRGWKDDIAAECAAVTNYDQAIAAVNKIAHAHDLAHARALALALARAHARALALAHPLTPDLTHALNHAHAHARAIANARAGDLVRDLKIYKAHVALLDSAMKIGKQAEPIERAVIVARMTHIRTADGGMRRVFTEIANGVADQ